jgi:phospholipase C
MDGGAMDAFVTASCGSASNFAYADAATTSYYRSLAGTYALADRYFQPVAGASSANDMFFARAGWVFDDNTYEPKALGAACAGPVTLHQYTNPTIGDLLAGAGVPWAFYAEGYAAMKAAMANGMCPAPPADCPIHLATYPCDYDPGDDPFAYYKGLVDDPAHFRDLADFDTAVTAGTLPAVSYVKAIGYKTEHPGDSTITIGEQFVKGIVDAIQGSTYAHDTLVLVTWDESGGYFDHVKPPPAPASDMQPYGPRVPLLAVGDAVKPGLVSHTVMEHSSIARFIEWNWLGQMTGQLGTRDALVNNLGSLLDPAKTMVAVPEQ